MKSSKLIKMVACGLTVFGGVLGWKTLHRDKQGYNGFGYNRQGYNREGYDALGYDHAGYNRNGYDCYGYDHEGYDKYGFNSFGERRICKDEYDTDGYDKNGYDKNGYNKNGYNREGYHYFGCNIASINLDNYNRYHYNSEGIDIAGLSYKEYEDIARSLNERNTYIGDLITQGKYEEAKMELRQTFTSFSNYLAGHSNDNNFDFKHVSGLTYKDPFYYGELCPDIEVIDKIVHAEDIIFNNRKIARNQFEYVNRIFETLPVILLNMVADYSEN